MTATPQEILRTWKLLPSEITLGYELKGYLGEGSFGTVVLCTKKEYAKEIALKISSDADTIKTYEREAKTLTKFHRWKQEHKSNCQKKTKPCKSPLHNLGQATGFKIANKIAAIDTRFIKNSTTLQDKCSSNKLPMIQILSIFKQLIKTLRFLEKKGFIHADIKPDNILITEDGQVKLIDFGKAKKFPHKPKEYLQSYNYTHPLSILFPDDIDSKIDIWSLGCVLFKMITGKNLFRFSSDQYFSKLLTLTETFNGPIPREWLEKSRHTYLYYDRDQFGNYVLKPIIAKPNLNPQSAKKQLIIDPMIEASREKGFNEEKVRQLADVVIRCVSYNPPTYSEMLKTIRSISSSKQFSTPSGKELQSILQQLPAISEADDSPPYIPLTEEELLALLPAFDPIKEDSPPPPPPPPPLFSRPNSITVKA